MKRGYIINNLKFYFLPFKKQYFFPKDFKKYSFLDDFYKPYTLLGKIGWFFFSKVPFLYLFFKEKNIELYLSNSLFPKFINNNSLFSINLGTKGPEQKTTIIGKSLITNKLFFIKCGSTRRSIELIKNEFKVLNNNSHLTFIPKVIDYQSTLSGSILKTNFIKGKKLSTNIINIDILNILIQISKEKEIIDKNKILFSFSHGDFCPWNIKEYNNSIHIFDWELSNFYPLGYDLFTFIFQPFFLLNMNTSIVNLLDKNLLFIRKYFSSFSISNWKIYLIEFSILKVKNEKYKNNLILKNKYINLLELSKKI